MTLQILRTLSFETSLDGLPVEHPQTEALRATVRKGEAAERRLAVVEQADDDLHRRWRKHRGEVETSPEAEVDDLGEAWRAHGGTA